jgi:hypothetical protein
LSHLAGKVDGGIALLDRARLLNPNLAPAWFLGPCAVKRTPPSSI